MRKETKPEFKDDDESEAWYEGENIHFVDYRVWRTLEAVDDLISPYGLEVVCFEEDHELFTIKEKLREPAEDGLHLTGNYFNADGSMTELGGKYYR